MEITKATLNVLSSLIVKANKKVGEPKSPYHLYLCIQDDALIRGVPIQRIQNIIEVMMHMGMVYPEEIGMPDAEPKLTTTTRSAYPSLLHKYAATKSTSKRITKSRLVNNFPRLKDVPWFDEAIEIMRALGFDMIITSTGKKKSDGPPTPKPLQWKTVNSRVQKIHKEHPQLTKKEIYDQYGFAGRFPERRFMDNIVLGQDDSAGRPSTRGRRRHKQLTDDQWQEILDAAQELNPNATLTQREVYNMLKLEDRVAFLTFRNHYKVRSKDGESIKSGAMRRGYGTILALEPNEIVEQPNIKSDQVLPYMAMVERINLINNRKDMTDRDMYCVVGPDYMHLHKDYYDFLRNLDWLEDNGVIINRRVDISKIIVGAFQIDKRRKELKQYTTTEEVYNSVKAKNPITPTLTEFERLVERGEHQRNLLQQPLRELYAEDPTCEKAIRYINTNFKRIPKTKNRLLWVLENTDLLDFIENPPIHGTKNEETTD